MIMSQSALTILGIFAGSTTIIIVALVGFIGKGIRESIASLSAEMKDRQALVFKEIEKRQTKEVCTLKSQQEKERSDQLKNDIDKLANIARRKNAG